MVEDKFLIDKNPTNTIDEVFEKSHERVIKRAIDEQYYGKERESMHLVNIHEPFINNVSHYLAQEETVEVPKDSWK